ncbi:hypothetical protein UFOVP247_18 [uncultured Caudovirales phage]|uniref:Methyltransferase domain containing protein n=1 Tax=uncultured Caudovirales phage TaxID=2100421 RepID=A0A6J7WRN1_9CAUD|nr:hypothetical protein UFOVP247_18 [uncultured Caudovirales phage]
MDFDTAFKVTGTSKYLHGYQHFYKEMFEHLEIDSILEIGVQRGFSLKSWRMLWPNAVIEGVDLDGTIKPKYPREVAEDFTIFHFDSTDSSDVNSYIDRKYDVIIDDGDHRWISQLKTFSNFRNFCNKYYVIEDICGEYSEKKILERLHPDIIARSKMFHGIGPTRTFQHSDNIEKDAQYRVLFIDLRG